MKVKKDDSKPKKKKNILQQVADSGIKKRKRAKKLKVEPNTEVAEEIKKEIAECKSTTNKEPLKQVRWNSFLKAFLLHEKLNKKQRLMMEFCTNKGCTPPKRRTKFLNFIRNCYMHQADVTDDQVFELFDIIRQKYPEFISGTYHNVGKPDYEPPIPRLGKNKKKKLARSDKVKTNSSGVLKPKKKKKTIKVESNSSSENVKVSVKVEKNSNSKKPKNSKGKTSGSNMEIE